MTTTTTEPRVDQPATDERIRDMATTAIARETAQREAIATRLTREGLRHFLAQTDLVTMTDLVEGTPR